MLKLATDNLSAVKIVGEIEKVKKDIKKRHLKNGTKNERNLNSPQTRYIN